MSGELVILLHGILRSKIDMLPLSRFLEKHGYKCVNILYPSRKKSLEDLADFVHEKIKATRSGDKERRLNFVTHSMGGLITRYYVEKYQPENLGKVVMLSPPNNGSEFADYLHDHKLFSKPFRTLFGPASEQLGTSYDLAGTHITYPLGIIAGTKSINPLSPIVLPRSKVGDHDGIVPVARTKIAGMRDHITMPVNHTTMMFKREVMNQTLHFLKNSIFKV